MKKELLTAVVITAVVLITTSGAFSVMQSIRSKTVGEKVQQSQASSEKPVSQVESSSKEETVSVVKIAQTDTQVPVKTESSSVTSSASTSGEKIAYLTFDDGPSYNTPELLDILKENNVKATFFVIAASEDTAQKRAWMKREVDEGNTIGIHSWSHKYSYIYASESNFFTDFNKIRDMIVSATGVQPKFSRFPGGTDNTVSRTINHGTPIMPKLLQDVLAQGITPVDWNAGGMDAVIPVPTKDSIVKDVVNQCRSLKTAIILLHDSAPHASSIAAVPEIVKQLRAMGFTFEPLTSSDQVIRRSPAVKYIKK